MFGDPYEGGSVVTGMSQQELLRQKSRASAKSKSNHVNKKFKKKKRDRIVNLSAGLLGGVGSGISGGGGNNNNGGYLRSDNGNSNHKPKARTMAPLPAPSRAQWKNPAVSSPSSFYNLEEKEVSTAENSNDSVDSGVGPLHALDYSYSAIRVQKGVMNERSDEWLVESDARSLGESITSFPLLSTSAGRGIVAHEDKRPANYGNGGRDMHMDTHYDHNAKIVAMAAAPSNRNTTPRATAASQPPMSNRRGVRFAEKLATLRVIVYDRDDAPDCMEIPWDEQHSDSGSPTSVREVGNRNNANRRNGKTFAPSRPVSILRHRRFVGEVGSANFERSRRFPGAVSSPPRNDASGFRIAQAPPPAAMAPLRNELDFVDVDGFVLSPIRPSRMSYAKKGPSPARGESSYGQGHPSEDSSANAYYAARRAINQQDRPSGYAETVGDEEIYPDPPLELDVRTAAYYVCMRFRDDTCDLHKLPSFSFPID
jgi:hypothetical protein